MSFSNVGRVWTTQDFITYLRTVQKPNWCRAVCLHHTAAPSLFQRSKGLLNQHIKNIQSFYQNEKGWKAGPHFFVDENEIFGMTPPDVRGIHAASFNSYSLGIEVLGDYDTEFHNSGRGLECWQTAAIATAQILHWLNLPVNYQTVLFHRDDPKTRKTCPGRRVTKPWFLEMVQACSVTKATIPENHVTNKQFVVVSEYLQSVKGYTSSDIVRLLKKDEDGLFYFNDEWLEDAYYDKSQKATIAPISELCTIPRKK